MKSAEKTGEENKRRKAIENEKRMSELLSGKTGKSISVILDYLERYNKITTEVVAEITNKSEAQARRYLNSLEKAARIKKTKATKGNVYVAL